jgi:hypothetical protein
MSVRPKHSADQLSNLHAVQDDKGDLVLHNRISPSPRHLSDSVDTADKDGQVREDDGCEEAFEVSGFSEAVRRFVELAAELADSEENVDSHYAKDDEGSYLRGEAHHHDTISSTRTRSLGGYDGSSTDGHCQYPLRIPTVPT